jgi:hypothetical protein
VAAEPGITIFDVETEYIFALVDTFSVVAYMKGIVNVSKKKFVFVALDVNPEAFIFVVVIPLLAYRFPTT